MPLIHFWSSDARNCCPDATDAGCTGSEKAADVTCPTCRAAALTLERGAAETVKDAAAVTRRAPSVTQ